MTFLSPLVLHPAISDMMFPRMTMILTMVALSSHRSLHLLLKSQRDFLDAPSTANPIPPFPHAAGYSRNLHPINHHPVDPRRPRRQTPKPLFRMAIIKGPGRNHDQRSK
ncbi:hypothetical protein POX_e06317 [Penicillium oxalicum]|uniref:Uncharacterized protein n=1 Tax=Penicillium oxalicum (strain 114-2 / CGMCC 5302) TaxID=933388 RepID=S7Z9V2_PENO1|nr:hypothetical protein POX_e06317 [Penicillium oxalicum]EPS27345.1 hypothetical protein PDE_02288 [Penicillium oxalicum 114-2]KAI2788303.1 hypothetical protein POX_e06317 [Penicillium oxalicum]